MFLIMDSQCVAFLHVVSYNKAKINKYVKMHSAVIILCLLLTQS